MKIFKSDTFENYKLFVPVEVQSHGRIGLFLIPTYSIEGISGRDFIRKWEQQGSLSFTMVQRYLRVTISYCWSLLARGCQESNDSSTPYSPFPSLGHVASKYYQKAGIWIDINPNGHLDFMSSRTDD